MKIIKDWIKRTSLYNRAFFLFYVKETILKRFRSKSFGEFQEDLRIEQVLGRVETFVDIGANDGYHSSNTFYWALRGARGVCFEPLPEAYMRLRRLYLFNRYVACRNLGISECNRDATLVVLDDQSFIPETQDQNHRALYKARHDAAKRRCVVRLCTFDEALQGLDMPNSIDLLTIDVEGHELSVLRSIPFGTFRFRVLIIETHCLNDDGHCIWKHRDLDQIEGLLEARGYTPFFRTRGNTLYAESSVANTFQTKSGAMLKPLTTTESRTCHV